MVERKFSVNDRLTNLRRELDSADAELLATLQRRFKIVEEIAVLKKENNLLARDDVRWSQHMQAVESKAKELTLPNGLVRTVFDAIHKHSLSLHKRMRKSK